VTINGSADWNHKYSNAGYPTGSHGPGTGSYPADLAKHLRDYKWLIHRAKDATRGRMINEVEIHNEPNTNKGLWLHVGIDNAVTSIDVKRDIVDWPAEAGLISPNTAFSTGGTIDALLDSEAMTIPFGSYNGAAGVSTFAGVTRGINASTAAAHDQWSSIDEMTGFCVMTSQELADSFAYTARAIKEVDPMIRIGSPCFVGGEIAAMQLWNFLETKVAAGGRVIDYVDFLTIHNVADTRTFSGDVFTIGNCNGYRAMRYLSRLYGKPWRETEQSIYSGDVAHASWSAGVSESNLRKWLMLPAAFGAECTFWYPYAEGTNGSFSCVQPRLTGATWDRRAMLNTLIANMTAGDLMEEPTISGNNITLNIGGTPVTV
jgi:hypothetical protein